MSVIHSETGRQLDSLQTAKAINTASNSRRIQQFDLGNPSLDESGVPSVNIA